MAIVFKVGCDPEEFELPTPITLEFLQGLVGGMIEFVTFSDGSCLMVDEEGLLKGKEPNDSATAICAVKGWRGSSFPIVGDAVFFSRREAEILEEEGE